MKNLRFLYLLDDVNISLGNDFCSFPDGMHSDISHEDFVNFFPTDVFTNSPKLEHSEKNKHLKIKTLQYLDKMNHEIEGLFEKYINIQRGFQFATYTVSYCLGCTHENCMGELEYKYKYCKGIDLQNIKRQISASKDLPATKRMEKLIEIFTELKAYEVSIDPSGKYKMLYFCLNLV